MARWKQALLRSPLGGPLRHWLEFWRYRLNMGRGRAAYRAPAAVISDVDYQARLNDEIAFHKDYLDVSALPEITGYWANRYLRPLLEELGVDHPDKFAAKYLAESARRTGASTPVFASLGAGNCDVEVGIARLLVEEHGLTDFRIECVDINPSMRERGLALAEQAGFAGRVVPVHGDFNDWRPKRRYQGILANQSLHHVVNLESLFKATYAALDDRALFVVNDMIGRNGHVRWPEALERVHELWQELPREYRYNQQLRRQEDVFENWDCSQYGFEGVRAQDILPLLLQRFHFEVFIGYGNVVDVFVDRSFGHNFDADAEWDRAFIDRAHGIDEQGFASGQLTPTHMIAALGKSPVAAPHFARGLSPEASARLTA